MNLLVELKHQGRTYEEARKIIKEKHGRELSVRQLKYDMREMRDIWAKQNVEEITQMRNEEIARVDAMERLAWQKFYACTGKHNRETIEQSGVVDKDAEGKPIRLKGEWEGRKRVIVTEDSTTDERFWWGQIMEVQRERRRLLRLYQTNVVIDANVTHAVKGYVGWSPAEWDAAQEEARDKPRGPEAGKSIVIDGHFQEYD